jgi:hypothetical protein
MTKAPNQISELFQIDYGVIKSMQESHTGVLKNSPFLKKRKACRAA